MFTSLSEWGNLFFFTLLLYYFNLNKPSTQKIFYLSANCLKEKGLQCLICWLPSCTFNVIKCVLLIFICFIWGFWCNAQFLNASTVCDPMETQSKCNKCIFNVPPCFYYDAEHNEPICLWDLPSFPITQFPSFSVCCCLNMLSCYHFCYQLQILSCFLEIPSCILKPLLLFYNLSK